MLYNELDEFNGCFNWMGFHQTFTGEMVGIHQTYYETKTVCVGFQVYIRIWEVLVPFKYMFVLDITLRP